MISPKPDFTFFVHQPKQVVGDFPGIYRTIENLFETHVAKTHPVSQPTLHLFPELFLTGYPLQDLCLKKSFQTAYHQFLKQLEHLSRQYPHDPHQTFLLGGLHYQTGEYSLKNVIYQLSPGQGLEVLYTKRLLPFYDIFDEKKYFSPGQKAGFFRWHHWSFGLFICEDMWPGSHHQIDTVKEMLALQPEPLDLLINFSASPYYLGKQETRLEQAKAISHKFKAPLIYINTVGGEDEILFDGQSFLCKGDQLLWQAPAFRPIQEKLSSKLWTTSQLSKTQKSLPYFINLQTSSTPHFARPSSPKELPTIIPWNDDQGKQIIQALTFGLQEFFDKCQAQRFLIGLSGGLDSAVVLALMKKALKKNQSLEAIYMPSQYSAALSQEICEDLCHKLQVPLLSRPIKFLFSSTKQLFQDHFQRPLQELTLENLQARLRALILNTHANETKALILNTSNKSELAVGYSTLYGDSIGAISPLGDLWKTEVYFLAEAFNRSQPELFSQKLLQRAPSAELKSDQRDEDSLPAYARLDVMLESLLSYQYQPQDLIQWGFKSDEVKKVFLLLKNSEYKRKQFCPILKVKQKSFGFGYRNPITTREFL
jgi:NAD+ synthase (glutamine-hydrolysing)